MRTPERFFSEQVLTENNSLFENTTNTCGEEFAGNHLLDQVF